MDSADWDTRYAATETMWTERPNAFLVEKVEAMQPGRALDLGCGEGRNALWLAERGWVVTAVDFSEVAIERGRRWAAERGQTVDFRVADVTDFVPESQSYDLVIVFYLQLSNADVRSVLRRAADAVVPGGALLVVAHDVDNLDRGHGGPPSADVLYTPELVTGSLAGFQLVESGRVQRTVSTPDGERTAIDTLVLATRPN